MDTTFELFLVSVGWRLLKTEFSNLKVVIPEGSLFQNLNLTKSRKSNFLHILPPFCHYMVALKSPHFYYQKFQLLTFLLLRLGSDPNWSYNKFLDQNNVNLQNQHLVFDQYLETGPSKYYQFTAQTMKFSVQDLFSKREFKKLRICANLLKKS